MGYTSSCLAPHIAPHIHSGRAAFSASVLKCLLGPVYSRHLLTLAKVSNTSNTAGVYSKPIDKLDTNQNPTNKALATHRPDLDFLFTDHTANKDNNIGIANGSTPK